MRLGIGPAACRRYRKAQLSSAPGIAWRERAKVQTTMRGGRRPTCGSKPATASDVEGRQSAAVTLIVAIKISVGCTAEV